jgi:hypothetical protein
MKILMRKFAAMMGTFLLSWSGQSQAIVTNEHQKHPINDALAGSIEEDILNNEVEIDGRRLTVGQIDDGTGNMKMAAHANSGPTTHSNVPGHANFADKSKFQRLQRPEGNAASHANSGPTTHSNVPGHANFANQFEKLKNKGTYRR